MTNTSSPIACTKIGSDDNRISCCYADNLSSQSCRDVFSPQKGLLEEGCYSGNCISSCQNTSLLYTSRTQTLLFEKFGDGKGPIIRFDTCVNIPSIFRSDARGLLPSDISNLTRQHIPEDTNATSLQAVTAAVTECLSETCRNSRNSDICYDDFCSPVKLLTNNTTPNLLAINSCLFKLCNSGYDALPYADSDVVGIGVFSSYILQCVFILILWLGFLFSALRSRYRNRRARVKSSQEKQANENQPTENSKFSSAEKAPQQTSDSPLAGLLLNFHKTQCYFSGTLMIASLTYGIFETDMLVTFMLIPLSINGVLPITFAYLLLALYGRISMGISLLTMVVYLLASVVYWTLYAHLIPVTSNTAEYRVYEQFMYKLSAIPECGGYSALAVCPENMRLGSAPVQEAGLRLRILTPIIWTFSTIVLLVVLGLQIRAWRSTSRAKTEYVSVTTERVPDRGPSPESAPSRRTKIAFWIATATFVIATLLQTSLLSIATSMEMMSGYWTFGQIVAVTIWIPPLLEYTYTELTDGLQRRRIGRSKAESHE